MMKIEPSLLAENMGYVKSITMNKAAYAAIKKSRDKYEKLLARSKKDEIVRSEDIDFPNAENCALCELYNNAEDTCLGCPIKEVSGDAGCVETQYSLISPSMWDTEYQTRKKQKSAFKEFVVVFKKMLDVAVIDNEHGSSVSVKFKKSKPKD